MKEQVGYKTLTKSATEYRKKGKQEMNGKEETTELSSQDSKALVNLFFIRHGP